MHFTVLPKIVVSSDERKAVVSTVEVAGLVDNGPLFLEATGSAACNNLDKFDHNLGVRLATGRALVKLGHQLIRQAERQIRKNDKDREKQRLAAEALYAAKVARGEAYKLAAQIDSGIKPTKKAKKK